MEALTVTLETAKKLKAAGFEQETLWFWQESYSISVLEPAHEDYGNPDVVQREVNRNGWRVVRDSRHEVGIPEVVFNWWWREVHEIKLAQIAAPTAQEVADQLPPQTMLMYSNLSLRKRSGFGGYEAMWNRNGVGVYGNANTMANALALLWLKLQEAN